ncbi:hypothetical protein SAMN05216276_101685 [Streptosporangium subroseum]|uniref:Excreted virulence factor EspC, type VII ESX diderm n=1 Tax=Streptosporangium subroseum TaxID=106412 RepID=A0A239HE63_9ACTN|nr:hypothetical protein [Streptosporangium subroseum]SNS79726.1 hypothetical protein SAMN05216276_101685 [Streptosporangium subroseum]
MAGLDLHFDALEQCRTATNKVVKQFRALSGLYPAQGSDSSIFGKLADSSALATALDDVEKTIDSELGSVTSKLDAVERALDDVQRNVRKADNPDGTKPS